MPDYDNTNRGALFRNEDRKSDKYPEYSGTINVDGREFWLSAWVKEGRKGKFFSLSVKAKDMPPAKQTTGSKWAEPEPGPDPFEEVPF